MWVMDTKDGGKKIGVRSYVNSGIRSQVYAILELESTL